MTTINIKARSITAGDTLWIQDSFAPEGIAVKVAGKHYDGRTVVLELEDGNEWHSHAEEMMRIVR